MSSFHVRSDNGSIRHYHIRWSTKEVLDWEAFESRADAEASAAQLVCPDETYTIEERDEDCPRCGNAGRLKASHEPEATNPNCKYSWQQAVADAFQSPPENLPLKVNAAQRAISARLCKLCSKTPPDLNEQIAIREALQSLRSLLPETIPKQSSTAPRTRKRPRKDLYVGFDRRQLGG